MVAGEISLHTIHCSNTKSYYDQHEKETNHISITRRSILGSYEPGLRLTELFLRVKEWLRNSRTNSRPVEASGFTGGRSCERRTGIRLKESAAWTRKQSEATDTEPPNKGRLCVSESALGASEVSKFPNSRFPGTTCVNTTAARSSCNGSTQPTRP